MPFPKPGDYIKVELLPRESEEPEPVECGGCRRVLVGICSWCLRPMRANEHVVCERAEVVQRIQQMWAERMFMGPRPVIISHGRHLHPRCPRPIDWLVPEPVRKW